MLPFIIAGLTSGSVYALAGVGLVLTYKTSGIFNFAHGALATVSAYLFYTLWVQHHVPWPIAAFICVFVVGPLLALGLERVARSVAATNFATRVVATIGVLLIIEAVAVLIYGTTITRLVPPFLPQHEFHVAGTVVVMSQIITFAIGVVATGALYFYMRLTRTGIAMRAVVDSPGLLDIAGTNPIVVRRLAWIIGVVFASASGLLIVTAVTLNATTLTFIVVAAFGSAAIGRFSSLPITYAGGLLIGIAAALCSEHFTHGLWSGLASTMPFIVLFAVLLVSPRRWLAERALTVPRSGLAWTAPWQVQATVGLALLVVLGLVPSFASVHITDYSGYLGYAILFLSLGLLVRTSGQVSLCHITFMAIGACVFGHLMSHGWPWGLALIVTGLIVVPIGGLLAIPAIRLGGLYLALATFGFGILVEYMFYTQKYFFGSTGVGVTVPMPKVPWLGLDGSDKSYYYLCLILTVAVAGLVVAINRSRLGRLLRALADSPTGLLTSGTSVNVTRVLVFCLSAFLAAVAGVLIAGSIGVAVGPSYPPITSLVFFAVIIISPGGAPWNALVAALGLALIPSYLTSANTANWLQVLFGVGALAYAMSPPRLKGAPPALQRFFDGLVHRKPAHRGLALAPAGGSAVPARAEPGGLQVSDLMVTFGGLVAVEGAHIEAPTGRITGLIGPNGAGKTTLFNSCSGLNRPSRGTVSLDGIDVSRRGPALRARRGLGRTFQQMELFDTLTVWQNVALGLEGGYAGPNALRHLMSSRTTTAAVRAAANDALRQCDLVDVADRTAGSLSTGQRRLVELARCLAGPFRILLLDEPSSGLDGVETERFGQILKRVVAERGIGILLVEHDISLVSDVCDYIYVLDFGRPIFDGTAEEVLSSPIVRAAYLGGDEAVQEAAAIDDPRVSAEVVP